MREKDRETPPDIILKVVRAMKLYIINNNISIRQATSEFNMNYRKLMN